MGSKRAHQVKKGTTLPSGSTVTVISKAGNTVATKSLSCVAITKVQVSHHKLSQTQVTKEKSHGAYLKRQCPPHLISYGNIKQGEGSFCYPSAVIFPNSGEKAQEGVGRGANFPSVQDDR